MTELEAAELRRERDIFRAERNRLVKQRTRLRQALARIAGARPSDMVHMLAESAAQALRRDDGRCVPKRARR